MQEYLLSSLIFLPLIALVFLLLVGNSQEKIFKSITILVSFVQLLITLWIYIQFVGLDSSLQFVEQYDWINLQLGNWGMIRIEYFLGVDSLSIVMVLLTGIVMFIGAISSWNIAPKNPKGYFLLYLLLCSSIQGCFLALDFFLFYLFFEFMLLPMYFLIGIWGGQGREYASIKFFLYTLLGSIFILIVMIALNISVLDAGKNQDQVLLQDTKVSEKEFVTQKMPQRNQVHTFNLILMQEKENFIPGSILHPDTGFTIGGVDARLLAFLALMIGFAIKLPVVPFHTWLPDAHVEAPTPVSVVLAGILLKIGGYGIIRIAYSIFPEEAMDMAWWIAFFGMFSILYGAFNALAMSDLKKMIAYSSVSHMGFVLIAIASLNVEGFSGAVFQMFSHGILSSMLFLLVGVLYDRTHDREIASYRGLISKMPYFSVFVIIGFFASLGLPAFSGFIGELFCLLAVFNSNWLPVWIGIVSAFGIVLGAVYFLWTLQKMFLGAFWIKDAENRLEKMKDLDAREVLMLSFLSIITIATGIFPSLIFSKISDGFEGLMRLFS